MMKLSELRRQLDWLQRAAEKDGVFDPEIRVHVMGTDGRQLSEVRFIGFRVTGEKFGCIHVHPAKMSGE